MAYMEIIIHEDGNVNGGGGGTYKLMTVVRVMYTIIY